MIEILVVLAILGLALGLVVYRGARRSDELELRAAADAIAEGLRVTRAAAFRTDRPAAMRIDPAHHVVVPAGGAPIPLAPLVTVSFTGDIVFEPDGASGGAAIRLAEGGDRRVVGVDWISGRITVRR